MARLLIAEDDPEIAMLERDYLEMEGYEVAVVDNGQRAATEALKGEYDLILLDLMLPGMSGKALDEASIDERAFARTLADSVLKDFCYKNVVRNDLLAYIRNDLSGDPNNFWVPEIDRESLQDRLERGMESAVGDVVKVVVLEVDAKKKRISLSMKQAV